MRNGSVLLIVRLALGAIAGGQRHYYNGPVKSCGKAGTIAVRVLAAALNYVALFAAFVVGGVFAKVAPLWVVGLAVGGTVAAQACGRGRYRPTVRAAIVVDELALCFRRGLVPGGSCSAAAGRTEAV